VGLLAQGFLCPNKRESDEQFTKALLAFRNCQAKVRRLWPSHAATLPNWQEQCVLKLAYAHHSPGKETGALHTMHFARTYVSMVRDAWSAPFGTPQHVLLLL
jgi:hypothetical protein